MWGTHVFPRADSTRMCLRNWISKLSSVEGIMELATSLTDGETPIHCIPMSNKNPNSLEIGFHIIAGINFLQPDCITDDIVISYHPKPIFLFISNSIRTKIRIGYGGIHLKVKKRPNNVIYDKVPDENLIRDLFAW